MSGGPEARSESLCVTVAELCLVGDIKHLSVLTTANLRNELTARVTPPLNKPDRNISKLPPSVRSLSCSRQSCHRRFMPLNTLLPAFLCVRFGQPVTVSVLGPAAYTVLPLRPLRCSAFLRPQTCEPRRVQAGWAGWAAHHSVSRTRLTVCCLVLASKHSD